MGKKLPTICGSKFKWDRTQGTGSSDLKTLRVDRFPPNGFYVKSPKTGAELLFLPDPATMEANEFFDGEAYAYLSPGNGLTVQIWVGY